MKNSSFKIALLATALVASSSLSAQTDSPSATPPAGSNGPGPSTGPGETGGARGNRGPRGNFNPEEMRTRMMSALREQMGVTKDDEWALISERINSVAELRRAAGPGFGGGFRGPGGGGPNGGGGGGNRRGPGGGPEAEALRSAISDNLPNAEIQARLTHLREVRKENEAKLTKAQEDLRAVLNVKQEAVAVLDGLLP